MMNNNTTSNNKRIAKNTIYLYIRMLFTLFVGLFTSRVVLNALGVNDYGLYNVVAGVISLLGYVSSLLNVGTSRFLTIGLGKGNITELKKLFTACFSLHIIISLLTLLLGETLGLWFVNTHLVIQPDRMFAANVVYQLSLFSSMITFIQAPFQASIISHEKLGVFAYMSIYDVVMKLLVALLLLYVDTDKLILYSVSYFVVNVTSVILYNAYCRRHFVECSFHIGFDIKTYREIGAFIGWNAVGTFAYLANSQGLNILLNIFYTTVVNAARGLAMYVSGVVSQFITNFQTAARPQIVKLYAQGRIEEMHALISNTSKYSAFILTLMGVPVMVETHYLLYLWLGNVPQHVVPFIRITILQMLITSMYSPLADGVNAIGKMKKLNIFSVCNYFSFLLLWYILMTTGFKPEVVYSTQILLSLFVYIVYMILLKVYSGFKIIHYIKINTLKVIFIFVVSLGTTYFIHTLLPYGFSRMVVVTMWSLLISMFLIFFFGLDKSARNTIVSMMSRIVKNINSKLFIKRFHEAKQKNGSQE